MFFYGDLLFIYVIGSLDFNKIMDIWEQVKKRGR